MHTKLCLRIPVILALIALLVTGCASVPMEALVKDTESKQFVPAPDKASLYIYRNEVLGAAIPMSVFINGKNLGQTASKTYFHLSLIPGQYDIDSIAENNCSLSLSVEPNQNYFVWQEIKMGMWMARCALHEVGQQEGREGVTESKLIKMQISVADILPLGQSADSVATKIRELNELYKDGLITEDEYHSKKKELLDQL
ncbi:DUF2846 domain-containing protein [Amphritea atlantica]|uniref:DUF2846 domain-containing protein n=1 Tax=Amphritea atlantica TaxID=355243 RepID=A0ABY5GUE5_9GAMM|nr:DUF2846 domain-containing protein [Amphritea atlantica]